jgi:hypothetical protein
MVETSFKQTFDIIRFFNDSYRKSIVSILKEGMFNIYVNFDVSYAFVAKEVFEVENVFGFVVLYCGFPMS